MRLRSLNVLVLVVISLGFVVPAAAQTEDDTFEQLELFSRVLSHLQSNYVEEVDEKKLMYGAIRGMLETLDPHTVFMPPEVFKEMKIDTSGEYGGLGFEVAKKGDALTVVAPFEDTPASRAGIRSGDLIMKIDDEPTTGMDLATALQRMRGPAGKRVVLSILREGFSAPRDIAVVRDHIRIIAVEGTLYEGIAHVKVKNFQDKTDFYLRKELDRLRSQNGNKPLRGLVLDLRNNPGGLLEQAVLVSDRFLKGNLAIVSTKGRLARSFSEERSKEKDTEPDYPMVVLVNAGSASAAEIVSGALQDHGRATILGVPTFGKGSVQTVIELEDGSGLKLTIARYFTPKGRSIQERGIQPDYLVEDVRTEKSAKTTREKDLNRHFRAEGEEKVTEGRLLPPLSSWAMAEKVADIQLKVALQFLNDRASSREKKP